ncbi:MAG: galactokinase [Nocardioidaceae bacterium]
MGRRWSAPGRVNLIGEHTDYNDGFVLPLALPHRTTVDVSLRDDDRIGVRSALRPDEPATFAVSTQPGDVTGWAAYVAGVVWALRERGLAVPASDLSVESDVPLGAGLSSSAALECAAATAFNDLGAFGLGRSELARVAQEAENSYVGMPCGMMDQMAAMHGAPGQLVFLDTRTSDVEHVPFDLDASGLALLVVDTRAPHRLVDGEYSQRRHDCEEAAQTLGLASLRDARPDLLDGPAKRVLSERLQRRARHVVTENARVLEVVEILRTGDDPRAIGPALTASHESLRVDFEVTVPELDTAVEVLLAAGAHGARMTGAGFGGSVIALVEADAADDAAGAVRAAFAERDLAEPRDFTVAPAAGAGADTDRAGGFA